MRLQVASVVTAGGNFVPSNVGTGNAPAGFGLVVPPSPKKPMVRPYFGHMYKQHTLFPRLDTDGGDTRTCT